MDGSLITTVTALTTLWIGYRILKIPMGLLVGMLAGLQTQPAALGLALEQTGNDLPNVGYATVFQLRPLPRLYWRKYCWLHCCNAIGDSRATTRHSKVKAGP